MNYSRVKVCLPGPLRRPLNSRPSPLLAVGSQEPLSTLQTEPSKASSTGPPATPALLPLRQPLPPPLPKHQDVSYLLCLYLSEALSSHHCAYFMYVYCYSWHHFFHPTVHYSSTNIPMWSVPGNEISEQYKRNQNATSLKTEELPSYKLRALGLHCRPISTP